MKFIFPRLRLRLERWKWNSELNVYASTFGHFKDKNKKDIKPKISNGGYLTIKCNGKTCFAHRVVLMTWKPITDGKIMTVDHLDHNKRNNSLENLEWVTFKENQKRSINDYDASVDKDYICCGDVVTVANWLIKTQVGMGPSKTNADRVVKRILNAATRGTPYCNYTFSNTPNGMILVRG